MHDSATSPLPTEDPSPNPPPGTNMDFAMGTFKPARVAGAKRDSYKVHFGQMNGEKEQELGWSAAALPEVSPARFPMFCFHSEMNFGSFCSVQQCLDSSRYTLFHKGLNNQHTNEEKWKNLEVQNTYTSLDYSETINHTAYRNATCAALNTVAHISI